VEEMRRKKIESELQNSGWVSADMMGGNAGGVQPDMQFQPPPGSNNLGPGGPPSGGMRPAQGGPQPQTGPVLIDDWFSLEPVGRIHLVMSFGKHNLRDALPPKLSRLQLNTRATRHPSTLGWVAKEPFVNEKKKWSSNTATSSCNSNSTMSCDAHFAANFSSTPPACSVQTVTTLATRSVIRKWSPNVSRSPTPKPIQMRPSSTIAFLIDSRTSPIWVLIGAVIVVTSFRWVESRPRSAQVR
jgi:hypothetical protein